MQTRPKFRHIKISKPVNLPVSAMRERSISLISQFPISGKCFKNKSEKCKQGGNLNVSSFDHSSVVIAWVTADRSIEYEKP